MRRVLRGEGGEGESIKTRLRCKAAVAGASPVQELFAVSIEDGVS